MFIKGFKLFYMGWMTGWTVPGRELLYGRFRIRSSVCLQKLTKAHFLRVPVQPIIVWYLYHVT